MPREELLMDDLQSPMRAGEPCEQKLKEANAEIARLLKELEAKNAEIAQLREQLALEVARRPHFDLLPWKGPYKRS
jgi:hypothetical protein